MKNTPRRLLFSLCTLTILLAGEARAQAPNQDPFVSLPAAGFSLERRIAPGQLDYYKITRRRLFLDDAGQMTRRVELVGHFRRQVTTNQVAGRYTERIIWGTVWVRDSAETASPALRDERTLAFADNFSYEGNFQQTFEPASLDLSALPRTPDGLGFASLTWAAHWFDRLLSRELGLRELTQLGARTFRPATGTPLAIDFKPMIENSSYTPGDLDAQLVGLTRVDRVPCALLNFTAMGNRLEWHQRGESPIELRGTEHYWGEAAVALGDGKIMHAELTAAINVVSTAGGAALRTLDKMTLERVGP